MAKSMTLEELQAALAQVQAENDALKAAQRRAATRGLTAKPSEKGALSVYGFGRFPVTLYASQWKRVKAWINEGSLDDALVLYADVLKQDKEPTEAAPQA